jgi:hypothetical protein
MKTLLALTALALASTSALLAQAASDEEMMAEMKKCEMCKHIAADPGLMQNMTWETHKIDNGMLCVSTVPKEMKSQFDALSAKMESSMQKMKTSTEKPELCEICEGMSELVKSGAKEKEIELTNGSIHMLTSDDPSMVQKIHAEADKAIEMQKQMAEK